MTEYVYVIQPIEAENYEQLHEEIVALIESAGGVWCGTAYQTIREVSPATYIGAGKVQEISDTLLDLPDDETTVLFNGELTPSQTLNLSEALGGRKVIDRTTLILDIFAKNAKTAEGKLQIELAQLNYLYPRLKGRGAALSRLGGGIGTRGPGETQLETDRRHIRHRIQTLKERLAETETRRTLHRERRKKNAVKTIALVGYTNTGKSTLLNALTGADVYVKDELFATLDPTTRRFAIEGIEFLLVDTVGFLQALPHQLIEAFHSTLESALEADLALIVCDAQGDYEMQLKTTLATLSELSFDSPYLIVMNKSEGITDTSSYPKDSVFISAKEALGLEYLKKKIREAFRADYLDATLFIPYTALSTYQEKKKNLIEQTIEYTDEGQIVKAVIPAISYEDFRPYFVTG